MSRTLAAPIGTVWAAVTQLDRIALWFTPVSGEARIGGRYQLDGNAGGEVLVCDAPRTHGGRSTVLAPSASGGTWDCDAARDTRMVGE
ncbi:hypothetical protein O4214_14530 [Rhodococcus erythropolis]|uniref:hypothetical protein n=1 Tax=Rhodococcus erythropolis TaxID=1833 RepID=UPI001E64DAD4|nr:MULTISPECIES: hypothetical protein [Rhodococcus erythropolis group]MCD2104669.1 hypothetical protein [Rhodococcus qingshengii]MCZ4525205.1 hypothetical protein [Rhodococcus erythropolis]